MNVSLSSTGTIHYVVDLAKSTGDHPEIPTTRGGEGAVGYRFGAVPQVVKAADTIKGGEGNLVCPQRIVLGVIRIPGGYHPLCGRPGEEHRRPSGDSDYP